MTLSCRLGQLRSAQAGGAIRLGTAPGMASFTHQRGGNLVRQDSTSCLTMPSTSTRSRSIPRSTVCPSRGSPCGAVGRAHAEGIRILHQAVSEVYSSSHVQSRVPPDQHRRYRRRSRPRSPVIGPSPGSRQTRCVACLVPATFQERAHEPRLRRLVARGVFRDPGCRRAAASELERRRGRYTQPAQWPGSRMGPDR